MTQLKNGENESLLVEEFFNKQWKIYQKVLNNNYMSHNEIYVVFHKFLVSNFQKPFKMLDLGCGDASFTSLVLSNTNITSYHGVDLSIAALEIAQENLKKINCDITLIQGDFSEVVPFLASDQEHRFDVIFTSFALHHLQLQQKEHFINQLQNLLIPGGVFILIDIIRQETEDRDSYILRYLDNVQKYWSLLTPEEYSMVQEHISTSDFPETQQTIQEISQKSGFNQFKCLYRDQLNTTQLLCFSQELSSS
ncbi:class I SAM-dependent methyltransferase [Dolichospermum planctonicum]|uniref:Methyltransferase type 12 n=1 Tax=Dolichospermum planctonicum TaxID=136072 RepID=A0A480AGH5_9CYAN|nr:class I SAM-dependent methyltransferase [Dolichospermum planctonicum]GCL42368.1 methyltransferase type 12 [Dolichospermum planctonicum]